MSARLERLAHSSLLLPPPPPLPKPLVPLPRSRSLVAPADLESFHFGQLASGKTSLGLALQLANSSSAGEKLLFAPAPRHQSRNFHLLLRRRKLAADAAS